MNNGQKVSADDYTRFDLVTSVFGAIGVPPKRRFQTTMIFKLKKKFRTGDESV